MFNSNQQIEKTEWSRTTLGPCLYIYYTQSNINKYIKYQKEIQSMCTYRIEYFLLERDPCKPLRDSCFQYKRIHGLKKYIIINEIFFLITFL
jgi:hypothetical protein